MFNRKQQGDSSLRSPTGRLVILVRGITSGVLKPSGTHPSLIEQLTNFVSDGSSVSLHSLMRNVGQGSNRQDLVGEFLII